MNWRGRHIYLVGLPGSGKTSIGREFVKLLSKFKYTFVDLDELIAKRCGQSIPEIFDSHGEEYFRDIETLVLQELSDTAFHQPKVIATGGGSVVRAINRAIMRGSGLVVHVDVSIREAADNIIDGALKGQSRPLLKSEGRTDLLQKLETLKKERERYYEEATLHFVVRGNATRAPEELADEMHRALQELSTKITFKPAFKTTLAQSALRTYPILSGNGIAAEELHQWLTMHDIRETVILTDSNVDQLHATKLIKRLAKSLNDRTILHRVVIDAGEVSKSKETLFELLDFFQSIDLSRRSALITVGGGVVTDIGGLAASLFKRGLQLVHVPTTLLAQVDASIGGKTGIDHGNAKNLIGTVYPPHQIIIDPLFLKTLDKRDLYSGLGELVKIALIGDRDLWNELASSIRRLILGVDQTYVPLIREAVRQKLRFVEEDEFEESVGVRELLNFGHTFAHALEAATGFEIYRHGEAVLLGMRAAAWLSMERGLLDEQEWKQIEITLGRIPSGPSIEVDGERILESMSLDKKRRNGRTRLVLLKGLGEAFISDDTTQSDVRNAIEFMRSVS